MDTFPYNQYNRRSLMKSLALATSKSPYYRRTLRALATQLPIPWEDFIGLPVTPPDELRNNPLDFLIHTPSDITNVFMSSGSTGKPKVVYITKQDNSNDNSTTDELTGLSRKDMIVMLVMGTDSGTFLTPMRWREREFRFVQLETGLVATQSTFVFELMERIHATAIKSSPNTILKLTQAGVSASRNLKKLGIRRIVLSGSTLTENVRHYFEREWGAEVYATYGCNEIGNLATECKAHGELHINTRAVLIETVDMRTNKPVPPGTPGKVLITALENNQSVMLVRYEIGDLAKIVTGTCRCGVPGPRIVPLGRLGELVTVGRDAVPIYPYMIMDNIAGYDELTGRFELTVSGAAGKRETVSIRFESFKPRVPAKPRILKVIRKDMIFLFPALASDIRSGALTLELDFTDPDTILREWGRKPQSLLIDRRVSG